MSLTHAHQRAEQNCSILPASPDAVARWKRFLRDEMQEALLSLGFHRGRVLREMKYRQTRIGCRKHRRPRPTRVGNQKWCHRLRENPFLAPRISTRPPDAP